MLHKDRVFAADEAELLRFNQAQVTEHTIFGPVHLQPFAGMRDVFFKLIPTLSAELLCKGVPLAEKLQHVLSKLAMRQRACFVVLLFNLDALSEAQRATAQTTIHAALEHRYEHYSLRDGELSTEDQRVRVRFGFSFNRAANPPAGLWFNVRTHSGPSLPLSSVRSAPAICVIDDTTHVIFGEAQRIVHLCFREKNITTIEWVNKTAMQVPISAFVFSPSIVVLGLDAQQQICFSIIELDDTRTKKKNENSDVLVKQSAQHVQFAQGTNAIFALYRRPKQGFFSGRSTEIVRHTFTLNSPAIRGFLGNELAIESADAGAGAGEPYNQALTFIPNRNQMIVLLGDGHPQLLMYQHKKAQCQTRVPALFSGVNRSFSMRMVYGSNTENMYSINEHASLQSEHAQPAPLFVTCLGSPNLDSSGFRFDSRDDTLQRWCSLRILTPFARTGFAHISRANSELLLAVVRLSHDTFTLKRVELSRLSPYSRSGSPEMLQQPRMFIELEKRDFTTLVSLLVRAGAQEELQRMLLATRISPSTIGALLPLFIGQLSSRQLRRLLSAARYVDGDQCDHLSAVQMLANSLQADSSSALLASSTRHFFEGFAAHFRSKYPPSFFENKDFSCERKLYLDLKMADPLAGCNFIVSQVEFDATSLMHTPKGEICSLLMQLRGQRIGSRDYARLVLFKRVSMLRELNVQTFMHVLNYLWRSSCDGITPRIEMLAVSPLAAEFGVREAYDKQQLLNEYDSTDPHFVESFVGAMVACAILHPNNRSASNRVVLRTDQGPRWFELDCLELGNENPTPVQCKKDALHEPIEAAVRVVRRHVGALSELVARLQFGPSTELIQTRLRNLSAETVEMWLKL